MSGDTPGGAPEAFFLPSESGVGHRFALLHCPGRDTVKSAIVFAHALGEEMNKSRRMAAVTARRLANEGHAVLQIDLRGCGDSSGDFGDATWEDWLADLRQAVAWTQARYPDVPLILWGHRAGCLLATNVAQSTRAALLFWQPPVAGKVLLQQMVRHKLVASLHLGDVAAAPGPSVSEAMRAVRGEWHQGRSVVLAGYEVSAGLALGLEAAHLRAPPVPTRSVWLEVSSRDPPTLLPATTTALAEWRAAGHDAGARVVKGPAFWATLEIEDVPALLDATSEAVASLVERSAGGSAAVARRSDPLPRVAVRARLVERCVLIGCQDQFMPAILAHADGARGAGVLVVVGGPQYRVGSHRQFVQLARALALLGHYVLRFDVRGMGDATGASTDFEKQAPDIGSAIDALASAIPSGSPIVLWGLCDGASAALLYVQERNDLRVSGLVLANPWVRSASSLARAHITHYYWRRMREAEFWRKLLRGRVGFGAIRELVGNLAKARSTPTMPRAPHLRLPFQQRMAAGLANFRNPVLVLLSEHDITAAEFTEFSTKDESWCAAMRRQNLHQIKLRDADHTFSTAAARLAAEDATAQWLARQVLEHRA